MGAAAGEEGESDDDLVGWKDPKAVGASLEKHVGRDVNAHALNENVHRLRLRFRSEGANWFLVQTDPKTKRVRFATPRARRSPTDITSVRS